MSAPYQPSGLFDVSRLALAIAGLLVLAAACSLGLGVATAEGWYFLAIVPAAAVFPLGAAGYPAAQWAHLRNPRLAAAIGAALGVAMYVGQYYFIMVHDLGTEAILRFDILPECSGVAAADIQDSIDTEFKKDPVVAHLKACADELERISPWNPWFVERCEPSRHSGRTGWMATILGRGLAVCIGS